MMALAAGAAAQNYPTFAQQWASLNQALLVQNQGSYNLPNGDFCCAVDSECQVQIQYSEGTTYFDLPNNRTTDVYGVNYQPYAIVSLFNINREMAVDNTFTCTSYCPLDEGPMEPFDVSGSVDGGSTIINGKKVEAWVTTDVLPIGNITMETDTLYVDQSNMQSAVPIVEVDLLTPFGEQIGVSNTTYLTWVPGAPDAKYFNVKGISACPLDSNCGNNDRQMYRLRTKQHKLFMKHHLAQKARAAAVPPPAPMEAAIEEAKAAFRAGKPHRVRAGKRHH